MTNQEQHASTSTSTSASSSAAPTTASAAPASTQTIAAIASANPDFSTLVTAVKAAGLVDTLSGAEPFTVFAPTNEAFAALPAATLQSLLQPANKAQLTAILTYHVVAKALLAKDVTPGAVTTVNGATFTVNAAGSGLTITDGKGGTAKIITTDIVGSNGVIHVIDAVLLPSA